MRSRAGGTEIRSVSAEYHPWWSRLWKSRPLRYLPPCPGLPRGAAARGRCPETATRPRPGRAEPSRAWRSPRGRLPEPPSRRPRMPLSSGRWRGATRWWTASRPSCGASWAPCGGCEARGRPSRRSTTCTATGRAAPPPLIPSRSGSRSPFPLPLPRLPF